MEIGEYTRKGSIMNTKEHYYIYQFNQPNKIIEEQKCIKEGDSQNSMFDIIIRHNTRAHEHHRILGYK
jgi:hypothetical protein